MKGVGRGGAAGPEGLAGRPTPSVEDDRRTGVARHGHRVTTLGDDRSPHDLNRDELVGGVATDVRVEAEVDSPRELFLEVADLDGEAGLPAILHRLGGDDLLESVGLLHLESPRAELDVAADFEDHCLQCEDLFGPRTDLPLPELLKARGEDLVEVSDRSYEPLRRPEDLDEVARLVHRQLDRHFCRFAADDIPVEELHLDVLPVDQHAGIGDAQADVGAHAFSEEEVQTVKLHQDGTQATVVVVERRLHELSIDEELDAVRHDHVGGAELLEGQGVHIGALAFGLEDEAADSGVFASDVDVSGSADGVGEGELQLFGCEDHRLRLTFDGRLDRFLAFEADELPGHVIIPAQGSRLHLRGVDDHDAKVVDRLGLEADVEVVGVQLVPALRLLERAERTVGELSIQVNLQLGVAHLGVRDSLQGDPVQLHPLASDLDVVAGCSHVGVTDLELGHGQFVHGNLHGPSLDLHVLFGVRVLAVAGVHRVDDVDVGGAGVGIGVDRLRCIRQGVIRSEVRIRRQGVVVVVIRVPAACCDEKGQSQCNKGFHLRLVSICHHMGVF